MNYILQLLPFKLILEIVFTSLSFRFFMVKTFHFLFLQGQDFMVLTHGLITLSSALICWKCYVFFFSRGKQWYEPEWWKFGDEKSYVI